MIFDGLSDKDARFTRANQYYEQNNNKLESSNYIKRLYENYDMASGIEGRQYGRKTMDELISQGLPATTINLIKKEVNSKVASLEENKMSTTYVSRSEDAVNGVNVVQDLFDYNKDRGDWNKEISTVLRDGNIMLGAAQMFWDFSHDREYGDIGLKSVNPKLFKLDADWITDDFKDCKMATAEGWLTPKEIKLAYGTDTPEINDAIKTDQPVSGTNTSDGEGLTEALRSYDRNKNYSSGKYRIVELHYMESQSIESLVNRKTGDKKKVSEMTPETAYAMAQHDPGTYVIDEEIIQVNKVFIFAPALMNKVLYDGDYQLQLGRLPFFIFAFDITQGEPQGLVDQLKDPQRMFNKREASITNILSKASNGNYQIEETAFSNPADKTKMLQNIARGGQIFTVADGANSEGKIKLMERQQVPSDLPRSADRSAEQLMDLAGSNDATQGKSGGSHESGALYSKKLKQIQGSDSNMIKNFKAFHRDIAESFYYAVPQVYAYAQRKLFLPDGRSLELNKVSVGPNGTEIQNDILSMPRYTFTISLDKLGTNKREEQQAQILQSLKVVTNPLMKTLYEGRLPDYEDFPADEKKKMVEASGLFYEFQKLQLESQINQFKLSNAQAAQQLAQLEGQGQPEAFMGPGGGQPQQPPQDARAISKGPGMGDLPNEAGIAGRQGAANNASNSPSDMTNR